MLPSEGGGFYGSFSPIRLVLASAQGEERQSKERKEVFIYFPDVPMTPT